MGRALVVLVTGLSLLGGGGGSSSRSAHIPPVQLSHSTIDRELSEAGVDAQLIQSLSEPAQGAKYDRVQFQTVSWRRSQDLALVALHRCRATEAGTSSWARYVATDERHPHVSHDAAARVNHFME